VKLAWATDIHLNFLTPAEVERFGREVADLAADAFVVTGDIAEAVSLVVLLKDLAASSGLPGLFVLGNHDFYGGRVADVRRSASTLAKGVGTWLGDGKVFQLGPGLVLVGVDGWGDARHGDPERSPVKLNDFQLIGDLRVGAHARLIDKLRVLGDIEGVAARRALDAALATEPSHILFATHVPPFRAACVYEGEPADDDWAPYFTCKAVGDVLMDFSSAHPSVRVTVLCGHSHAAAHVQVLPNLEVRAGAAEYGAPRVELLEFE
jgi:predicted phosphohydrolase